MKIAIDLRHARRDAPDAPSVWLRDTLTALFARDTPHTFVLFHTVANYHLFDALPPSAERRTLAAPSFYDELLDRLNYEGDFDLLLRAQIDAACARFPLAKQVALVPAWPPGAKEGRAALRDYQSSAAGLIVPSFAVRDALSADLWTNGPVILAPSDNPDAAADGLLSAFERAAAPRVRVSTPPVVSIVTPSFNQGAFIRQTIDSVLGQDYPHIDYQVIDGGSTDETLAVLTGYGNRVEWVSEKDKGQADAINKGMAKARGDIRAYLNSDDLLRPGAVSRVVEHFARRPACDLVYGRDATVDATGRFLGMFPTAEFSLETLADCCCISQPATFWRKRVADAIGPFDASLHLVMDYDYWLRAAVAGMRFEHIPDVLAHTRMHAQTKTSGAAPGAARERFFDELFAVCLRSVGYVSSRYVYAWLQSCIFPRRPLLARREEFVVRIVQTWYRNRHRLGKKRWRAALSVLNSERGTLLNPLRWFGAQPVRPAVGDDLWVGPEWARAHAGGPVRLTGVPARDLVLRVYRESEEVATFPLKGDSPADVCVEVPAGAVKLVFSESELLPDGRRVSFRLHGTTLLDAA